MKPLLEILQLSSHYFEKAGLTHARREAEFLLCDFLGINRVELYLNYDRPLEEKELDEIRKRLQRRKAGEPLAYIHGQVDFYACSLQISPAVLIPRPETEILVDLIVAALQGQELKGKRLLDLCTGSGCIGLALKKQLPDLDITLSDISTQALDVAKENAQRNQLMVRLVEGDLLAPFSEECFDYLVCNPPYIAQAEYGLLSPEVRQFEPETSLVGGKTGLEFYVRLKEHLPRVLNRSAKVWLEIGYSQGASILSLFQGPPWRTVTVAQDWSKHDRFISLEME